MVKLHNFYTEHWVQTTIDPQPLIYLFMRWKTVWKVKIHFLAKFQAICKELLCVFLNDGKNVCKKCQIWKICQNYLTIARTCKPQWKCAQHVNKTIQKKVNKHSLRKLTELFRLNRERFRLLRIGPQLNSLFLYWSLGKNFEFEKFASNISGKVEKSKMSLHLFKLSNITFY